MQEAILALADGSIFRGKSIGAEGLQCGELVFNTSMTGYQEILTDPSYLGQIVTLTYPHIGNTGVNDLDVESENVKASGLVIRDLPNLYHSWRGTQSLGDYLKSNNIVAISDIDTRELTRRLRDSGTQNACLMTVDIDESKAVAAAKKHPSMNGQGLAQSVGVGTICDYSQESVWSADTDTYPKSGAKYHVVAYDFGVKRNILRILADLDCKVTLLPANTPAEEALALHPDGIFLSNGPGDPKALAEEIEIIKELLGSGIPIFGICLGHQLLGLVSGAKTVKMKFGHHGANHPVQDLQTKAVMITSQNHGFAIDESTLPDNVVPTHRSLFDGTSQGIAFKDRPIFAFQGHPEASPGPKDAQILFNRFIQAMDDRK